MINSPEKIPAPLFRPEVKVEVAAPNVNIAAPPPAQVSVHPEITVMPAAVNMPSLSAFPEHPTKWDLEVVERDDLGLIKRVRATAIQ